VGANFQSALDAGRGWPGPEKRRGKGKELQRSSKGGKPGEKMKGPKLHPRKKPAEPPHTSEGKIKKGHTPVTASSKR